ncbi:hypothetical protein GCM10009630_10200 [Kribbella jejuensis]|uniref:NAD(P)H-dependent oxidoreductase n=1 Tax=Kribbella jejuensis TaxID=236068 RepID=UPI00192DB0CF|nr:NAD(P)H-dependent oxidoreductase [Kribbella jejuensis]
MTERVVATLERRGLGVNVHDLYAENFDPVLRADEAYTSGQSAEQVLAAGSDPLLDLHRRELSAASALVVVHPNWWGKPPAILAGWMDRVLVPGVAYRLDEAGGEPESLLSLREVLVFNTSDTTQDREAELFGDPLESIWLDACRPIWAVLESIGSSCAWSPMPTPRSAPAGSPGPKTWPTGYLPQAATWCLGK